MSVKKGSFYRSDKTEIIEQQKNKLGAARLFGRKENPDSYNHKQHQEAYQKFIEWLKSLSDENLLKVHKSNSLIYKKGRTEWSGAIAQSTFNNSKDRFLEGLKEEIESRGLVIKGKKRKSTQAQQPPFTGNMLEAYINQSNLKFSHQANDERFYYCPFHNDSIASLSVNLKRELWNCYPCSHGGNVFTLVRLLEELPNNGAVVIRLRELGIYREQTQEEKDAQRDQVKAEEEFYGVNSRFSTEVRTLSRQYPDYVHRVDEMIAVFDNKLQDLSSKVQSGEITIQTAARELQDVYRDRLTWFMNNIEKRGIKPVEAPEEINLDEWGED